MVLEDSSANLIMLPAHDINLVTITAYCQDSVLHYGGIEVPRISPSGCSTV
jgi:hypothetical protein